MGDSANALAATITQKLVESGEKDRLKDMLRARLIECGWRDSMKAHCKGEQQHTRARHPNRGAWQSKSGRKSPLVLSALPLSSNFHKQAEAHFSCCTCPPPSFS